MRTILVFMLLVVLNYVSCEAMDLSSLREDNTNNEDEKDISCDDWESPYGEVMDYYEAFTLCEKQELFCDEFGKDMIKSMEEFLEDPGDENKDLICQTKADLNYLRSGIEKWCSEDIDCDDEELNSSDEWEVEEDAGDDEELISSDEWEVEDDAENDDLYDDDPTSCVNQQLYCDDDTKDMVTEMEEYLEDPQDLTEDDITFTKDLVKFLNAVLDSCDGVDGKDIECDE